MIEDLDREQHIWSTGYLKYAKRSAFVKGMIAGFWLQALLVIIVTAIRGVVV